VAPDDDLEAALTVATPSQRAMVLLARYGCLRLTELTTLHTRAREGERLRVIGKGDKERIVFANEPLLFALHALERAQGPGYYFPGLNGPHMHPMSVNKIITRVTGWNPHSLRHAGATAAYNATGDLRGVQEMLGHASLATTQRYLHLDDAARRRVAEGTLMRSWRVDALVA
jgi:integrase